MLFGETDERTVDYPEILPSYAPSNLFNLRAKRRVRETRGKFKKITNLSREISTLTWFDDQHHGVRSSLRRSARIFSDVVRRDRRQCQFGDRTSRASFSFHVYSASCCL